MTDEQNSPHPAIKNSDAGRTGRRGAMLNERDQFYQLYSVNTTTNATTRRSNDNLQRDGRKNSMWRTVACIQPVRAVLR